MLYLLYARKSSESDDKQAQSIDDQLKELRLLAAQRGLTIVAELTEAKSAKTPGARPVFAEMVSRLQNGEAQGILCWHVNRLFRNPVDFGTLSWMLQTGVLQEIHTPSQVHRCGDNVLLLSVENGMANQYIIDLRKAVTRGLNSKVEKGWFPHKAPEGYLNQDGIIVQDMERFPLVRRAWDLMLSGTYTPPQILDIMTREWGYTSKKLKKVGGAPFTRTSIYNLFSNLFYTGYFKRNGEIFPGQHPPMVSMEEFLRVQAHLSRRFKKRKRTHDFAYSGLMECGECGRAVVGDRKTVKLKSGGTNEHVYYACANTHSGCSRKSVTEEQVDAQIQKLLASISIPAPIMELGHEVVQEWQKEQGESDPIEQELMVLEREISGTRRKRDRLLDMRMSDLLSDFEFLEQKERLTGHLNAALVRQQELRDQSGSWQENLQNVLHLAACGELAFKMGESALRALIAQTLGARYILTHKNLAVELNPVFAPLCEMKARLEANRLKGRPLEYEKAPGSVSGSRSKGDSSRIRQVWWNTLDATRISILQFNATVPRLMKPLQCEHSSDLERE